MGRAPKGDKSSEPTIDIQGLRQFHASLSEVTQDHACLLRIFQHTTGTYPTPLNQQFMNEFISYC